MQRYIEFAARAILLIMILTALTVAFPRQATAAQSQKGLPIDLRIDDSPPLDEQLTTMRSLYDTGKQYLPEGGLLKGIKSMFTGGDEEKPNYSPVANLLHRAESIRGDLVETEGIYFAEGDGGTLRSMGRAITVELMHGATPTGFAATDGEVDGMPVSIVGRVETAADETVLRASQIRPSALIAGVRIGRILALQESWKEAMEAYLAVANEGALTTRPLAAFARLRVGAIALEKLDDEGTARDAYSAGYQAYAKEHEGKPLYYVWVPEDEVWEVQSAEKAMGPTLDELNSGLLGYRIVHLFVRIAGGSAPWGVILMAVVVRLAIYPLTKKQIESQHRMQAIQPQIKELQEKHATDKQKFQEEFWALCQENDCNPLGGCLPMLVQMPILIFLYRGIREYIVQFDGLSFLWVENLAQPNMILLVLYTLSMVAFQKMAAKSQPTADPQQQKQQQMMAYMMPLMFFFFFQSFPAAFLLYWLGSNVIYFGEHWFLGRMDHGVDKEETASEPAGDGDGDGKKKSGFVGAMLDAAKRMSGGGDDEDDGPPLSYEERRKQENKKGRGRSR